MKASGATGRRFHRTQAQRRALFRGMATDLIEHGSLTTTHAKAKSLVPYTEKLISKAIKGGVRNKQLVGRDLTTKSAISKLFGAQKTLAKRTGGHLRITPQGYRAGDNAKMAKVEFVDELIVEPKAEKKAPAKSTKEKKA